MDYDAILAGFDFLSLASNHVLDAGRLGMDYTRKTLEDTGIVTGGVGYSQAEARTMKTIERNGIVFGFLNPGAYRERHALCFDNKVNDPSYNRNLKLG